MYLVSTTLLLFVSLAFFSCAKLGYILNQGSHQVGLQFKGRKIQKVLDDPNVNEETKSKLRNVLKAKTFFFKRFSLPEDSIYSKYIKLDQEAITYLVVASRFDKIEPLQHDFPFVGKFPYLGFFEEKDAIEYAEELNQGPYQTYVRSVYAYSTLGFFEDRVLSSFFELDSYDLTELIFHELFHTIFFIKGEVDSNESLANFFAGKLIEEYPEISEVQRAEVKRESKIYRKVKARLVQEVAGYRSRLEKKPPENKDESLKQLRDFLETRLRPNMKNFCIKMGIPEGQLKKQCFPLRRKWNHASFVGFLTYAEQSSLWQDYYEKTNLDLIGFFSLLKKDYEEYKDSSVKSFKTFVENKLSATQSIE